jgi:hypothetical protein
MLAGFGLGISLVGIHPKEILQKLFEQTLIHVSGNFLHVPLNKPMTN